MRNIKIVIRNSLEEILEKELINISDYEELHEVGLTSLGFIRLVVQLEKAFNFTLYDNDLLMDNFSTIDKAYNCLCKYNLSHKKQHIDNNSALIKCIVLDCDDVLWGGVAAEIGLNNIELGDSEIGQMYQDFQQELITLYNNGILLTLCSKNDEKNVWDVFDNHPNMILKREHITAYRINWQDKTENLISLANELNLGISSFLFIDDSEYEEEKVRMFLPMIQTRQFNPKRVQEFAAVIHTIIDNGDPALPGRAMMYKEQKERELTKNNFSSLEEYEKSLSTVIIIEQANKKHIQRLVEISKRTNQFNLTNRRYTENEVCKYLKEDNKDVFILSAIDKFGDMGSICASFLQYDNENVYIKSFFLSCRAFNRGFEKVMLQHIMKTAKSKGCKTIFGYFNQTEKNEKFKSFWKDNGFVEGDGIYFSHIDNYIDIPDYFKEIRIK